MNSTISITFGDCAENHVGMEKIGDAVDEGFTFEELEEIHKHLGKFNVDCKLVNLHEDGELPEEEWKENRASVLIIKNGVKTLFGVDPDKLFEEQASLNVDKKALMRGRVVNKHARWNLCYGDFSQEPEIKEGKGRVVNFADVKLLGCIRKTLRLFGDKTKNLQAEMNMYYDVTKCGIGFHGDTERKIVVCFRLGATMPLHFQWFHRSRPLGKRVKLSLGHGDCYIMSEKATGCDWKKSSKFTLRHAAGCLKYLTIKEKKPKAKK